jgi:serine protease inhibitor
MTIKEGFILRRIPGMNIVMPTGENIKNFRNAITLNDTAALIFEKLQQGESVGAVAEALASRYGIDRNEAAEDVQSVFGDFLELGLAEE